MLHVYFLIPPDGRLTGFSIQGHADHGEAGTDVVCAAVSSAAYLVVNTVTDVLAVTPLSLRAEEGDLFFRLEARDEPACRVLMQGLKLHLSQLEEQYPEHIRVDYMEI